MNNNLPRLVQYASGAAALVMLIGCQRSTPEIAKTPVAPIPVRTIHATNGEITRSITLPGNVVAYQQAILYAKIAGYLKAITVDKGDQVKAGDLLADIEVPELMADLVRYQAEVDVAAIDFQRLSEAQKKSADLVMPQTVDEARGRHDIAKANLKRIETLLGYAKITAPFSGVITRRWVDPGAFIPAATSGSAAQNAAVVTLMDFSKVRVQAAIPEPEVPFIRHDLPVKITVQELTGRAYAGTVTRYAQALDETSKTMLTEIEIPNPKSELRPGMYATVQVVVERKTEALLLPVEALVVEKTKISVFTVANNQAKKTVVKTGFNDGKSVEILEGVQAADTVILVGKQIFNDGQPVQIQEAK